MATDEQVNKWLNIAFVIGVLIISVMAFIGCATIKQERINPDGSSYTATGRVFLKGDIAQLKTTLAESVNEDGSYNLAIGQEAQELKADALELIELLNRLIKLIPPIP